MMVQKEFRNKSIRAELVAAMRQGEFASCAHLPRESVLSEQLGISRTQLRDILASLEREGFIYTLPAKGTYVAPKNVELLREENLKKIEGHIAQIARLAESCSLSREDIIEMINFCWEEEK